MDDRVHKQNIYDGEALRGLSSYEVNKRIRAGAVNGDATVKTKTYGEIVRTNVLTPFHAMNAVLFLAILIFGELKNALFMIVVVCNALIGIVQEIRAKKLIDRLSLISAPHALVIRDGVEIEIPAAELVKDDLVKYETGHQVCADSVVVQGHLEVDEALITGEDDEIHKVEGEELFSGSFVTSGSCFARVIHVGDDNYSAKITKQAGYLKRPKSEIMLGINKIIKTIGIAMLPIGALLFLKQYLISGIELSDAVTKTVAALVGMIPEGLVLLTSMVLAVGIVKLSRKNALVQELYSIEMLARVDVLCLDKTGTLTKGEMEVVEIYGGAKPAAAAIAYGLMEKSPTASAIRAAVTKPAGLVITGEVPFSSARKWSGIRTADGKSYVMGAPSFVEIDESKFASFDEMKRYVDVDALTRKYEEAMEAGLRVLIVCESASEFGEDEHGEPTLPHGLRPLGLVILSDKIREGTEETMRFFTEQGVALKIISGDSPVTVSNIAARCGVPGAENYIDASTVTSARELAAIADSYTVFGRVTPDQKLVIVQALKGAGHTVAMTGDGVNDVMALKESDCSIAPASGSDAARNVSQIILLDSKFSSLPSVVAEGRQSINNLQRSSALFLTKTVFSIVVALLLLFVKIDYPLQPIQLTLISSLTIGAPSFVLGLQTSRARVKGHFLTNVLTRALPGAFTDIVIVVVGGLVMRAAGLTAVQISTVSVLLIGFVGFMVLVKVCMPIVKRERSYGDGLNAGARSVVGSRSFVARDGARGKLVVDWIRVALIILMVGAFLVAITVFNEFFALVPMTAPMYYALGLFASVALLVYLAALLVVEKCVRGGVSN